MSNPSIHDTINAQVHGHDVVLYMKGTPQMPMCGFSSVVSQILRHLNVPFSSYNVLEDADLRQGIKDYTDWPTIPQLYIKGEFIGGCDIVKEMYENGELLELLKEKGLVS